MYRDFNKKKEYFIFKKTKMIKLKGLSHKCFFFFWEGILMGKSLKKEQILLEKKKRKDFLSTSENRFQD